MGAYVNLIDQVRERIQNQIDNSGSLAEIKKIIIGNRSRVDIHDTLPVLILEIDSITDDYIVIAQGQKNADFSLRLVLLYPLTGADTDNVYYNTTDSTGIIYLIEKILDVLNSRSRGMVFTLTFPFTFDYTGTEVDPRLNQQSKTAIKCNVQSIIKNAGYLEAVINLTASTNFYGINSLG